MRAWPSSGIFRGRIRRPSGFVRGNANWWTACWAPISSDSTFRRIARTSCRPSIESSNRASTGNTSRCSASTIARRCVPSPSAWKLTDAATQPDLRANRPMKNAASLLKSLGVEAALMGVGVDRIDYTQGNSGDDFWRSSAFWKSIRATRECLPSCRLAPPAAPTSSAITICRLRWRRRPTASIGDSRRINGSRSSC